MTETEILQESIKKFGVPYQLNLVIEEMAELMQAINKVKRTGLVFRDGITKPATELTPEACLIYSNACGEIADVKIMIKKLELIFNYDDIDFVYARKIEKLKKLL